MAGFEVLDHTADIGIKAHGSCLEEVFINAACGMFSLIAEVDRVSEVFYREIHVEASDQAELLVAWLNELLFVFDAEMLIVNRYEITSLEEKQLTARVYGDKVDPARHSLKGEIKAATYHLLKLEKDNGFSAQIIFDV